MKTMLKALFIGVFALAFVALPVWAQSTSPPSPVDICHFDPEMGTFEMMSVSPKDEPAHLAHGDGRPGETMDQEGFFEQDCTAWLLVGKVVVDTGTNTPTESEFTTQEGTMYRIVASGMYGYWPDVAPAGLADAKCSLRPEGSFNPGAGMRWILGDDLTPGSVNNLELRVDDAVVDWGANCNTTDHMYMTELPGTGAPFGFSVRDDAYGDNVLGDLQAVVYVRLQ